MNLSLKLNRKLVDNGSSYTVGALFAPHFCRGPFCAEFAPPKNEKGTLTDFRTKNDENFGFGLFLFGSLFYKRAKYLLIFVCNFKFSML